MQRSTDPRAMVGIKPKNNTIPLKGVMASDVLDAAIANIRGHMKTHPDCDNTLLTEWAIPQIESIIIRLRQ
jgi:hypothetical protein